jgi:ABC-type uncharacterized transport system involved in gliding motility auxiliary subunit
LAEGGVAVELSKNVQAAIGLFAALVLFLAANIVANESLTRYRLDVTQGGLFTLSAGTRNILAKLDEPVQIRFYFSAKGLTGYPSIANYGARVRDLLREYASAAKGRIDLHIIDPEAFSEAEDQAVADGIQRLPLGASGEMAYLGVVGTNSTDDRQVIPILQPDREDALEYEISKLIYTLATPKKRVIGIISTLPLSGTLGNIVTGEGTSQPWAILSLLEQMYELKDLGTTPVQIDQDIDTLLVIHPKDLPRLTQYLVDQFVLKGGKAMVFVDPLAEADRAPADPEKPMIMPKTYSDLPDLLKAWGVRLVPDKVVGDLKAAVRVTQRRDERGPQEIEYLVWLGLGPDNFNHDDFATNKLGTVNVGSAGVLEPVADAGMTLTPLLKTSTQSMLVDRDSVIFMRDPATLLDKFKAGGKEMVLAAYLQGMAKTAFPAGRPLSAQEKTAPVDPLFVDKATAPINVAVVADTDLLADRFWVQTQRIGRLRVPSPVADNADFVFNVIDRLGGNSDLISLRSRKGSNRPFVLVDAVRHEAEAAFRQQERALMAKLADTELQITALEKEKAGAGAALLSSEQKKHIDSFRAEQLKTRKELRAVQHQLKVNIERLGTRLKFINIGLMPVLVAFVILVISAAGTSRRKRPRQSPQEPLASA